MTIIDRRSSVRYACDLNAACRPIAMTGHWSGKTSDISAGGVCLVLSRRFEPGTMLSISLASEDESACMPLARVRQVTLCGAHWRLGCTWSGELSPVELEGVMPAEAN